MTDPRGGATSGSAVTSSVTDLMGRIQNCPAADLLAHPAPARSVVATNAVIGTVDPAAASESALAAVGRGHRTVKLKVGHGSVDADVELVRTVRRAVGPDIAIRIDANGSWDEASALTALGRLTSYAIEYVEDPVLGAEALARVRAGTDIPIALDEPLRNPRVLDDHLDTGAIDLAILKPTALGGPIEAVALARRAAAAGVGCVVTSFLDAAVGRAAALAVAAALPDHGAAGLATGSLLAADIAAGHPVENGTMAITSIPGLGLMVSDT